MSKQVPLIRKTPLTNRWVCITRYREKSGPNGSFIEATEKHDVHDQIEAIVMAEIDAAMPKQLPPLDQERVSKILGSTVAKAVVKKRVAKKSV